jgi:phosphohistidine phosphatase
MRRVPSVTVNCNRESVLYLVHHGDAVGADLNPMRPLSDRGRVEVDLLAEKAAGQGAKPDVIWHSGKLRARQTAEAYLKRCNPFATVSAIRGLQPTDPIGWIAEMIVGETRHIMLVGHFPHLPRLLGRLIAGDSEAGSVEFPLNGIVALEETDGRWMERWRLGPKG